MKSTLVAFQVLVKGCINKCHWLADGFIDHTRLEICLWSCGSFDPPRAASSDASSRLWGWEKKQQLPFIQLQQNPCDPELKCPFIQYSRRVQLLYPLCCECKYECLIYLKVQPCRSVHACSPHSYFILMNMRTLARSLMSSAVPSPAVCAPSSSLALRSSHVQSMTKALKVSFYYYLFFLGGGGGAEGFEICFWVQPNFFLGGGS